MSSDLGKARVIGTTALRFVLFALLCINAAAFAEQSARAASDSVPGPDLLVGDIPTLMQSGSAGTQVGLAIAVTLCNNGDTPVDFLALPNADHPVIAQNLYRMSGGAANDERFEQVGQSWVKHLYFALEQNSCGFGCTPSGNGTHLGVGCSDVESAGSNGNQSDLGSRAWVNPFTGVFPGSNPNPDNHTGHTHTGTSHRLLVEASDLNTTLNPGATYYAETQSLTPNEYAWCQNHPGQCNMTNNVSYRQFNVSGTTNFTFVAAAPTVRTAPAMSAWTGAAINVIDPAPGADGRAFVAWKVTNSSAGVWHYEYAIYNESLDRAIQSFGLPLGCGITANNPGFHAPPQHPGFANDGTQNNTGFSSAPWMLNQTANSITWNCETFEQDPNANAIRWGTLYNFRFDSNRPPHSASATIAFFKTGTPVMVQVEAPMPDACAPLGMIGAVSRKTHGSAGDFDVDLPLSGTAGVECRSSGGNHTLVFTFTNNVISGGAVVSSGIGNVSGPALFSANTMTVTLTGVTNVQTLAVTLSGVTDEFSQVLPDTTLTARFLIGDVNGNGTVNGTDVAQAKSQVGQVVGVTNFRADVNANGTINATDAGIVKSNVGSGLP